MELALRLLEPAPRRDPLLALRNRRGFLARLREREGGDHDRDAKHGEQGHHRQEREGGQQQAWRLRVAPFAPRPVPAEAALARHGAEIILGTGPFARRRLRHAVVLHASKLIDSSPVLNKPAARATAYFLRGTDSVATVSSPHLTVTVSTAWLFGIVSVTSHQLSRAAKPVSLGAMVGATSAPAPLTVAGESTAL